VIKFISTAFPAFCPLALGPTHPAFTTKQPTSPLESVSHSSNSMSTSSPGRRTPNTCRAFLNSCLYTATGTILARSLRCVRDNVHDKMLVHISQSDASAPHRSMDPDSSKSNFLKASKIAASRAGPDRDPNHRAIASPHSLTRASLACKTLRDDCLLKRSPAFSSAIFAMALSACDAVV
jgi:hypothetical protein